MAKRIVDVLVPVALDHTYSYRVPDASPSRPATSCGCRSARANAPAWCGRTTEPQSALDNRLKDVEAKLDVPPLKPELRRFVEWVSDYTLSPRGMVLRMALRMGEQLGPERVRIGVRLAGPPPERMTPARARVLELLADGLVRGKGDAAGRPACRPASSTRWIDEGTLEALPLPPEPVARPPDPGLCGARFLSRATARPARRCASACATAASR